jgi:hypothetical protein
MSYHSALALAVRGRSGFVHQKLVGQLRCDGVCLDEKLHRLLCEQDELRRIDHLALRLGNE